ncbi:hypothetical protein GCM10009105_21810 [Dokdonella soli]|uniref:Uncharacterized protein n=1 Tax=Dokdonella soli TaxID=529810 RepID=A0ABN1IKM1_9GAMM
MVDHLALLWRDEMRGADRDPGWRRLRCGCDARESDDYEGGHMEAHAGIPVTGSAAI